MLSVIAAHCDNLETWQSFSLLYSQPPFTRSHGDLNLFDKRIYKEKHHKYVFKILNIIKIKILNCKIKIGHFITTITYGAKAIRIHYVSKQLTFIEYIDSTSVKI